LASRTSTNVPVAIAVAAVHPAAFEISCGHRSHGLAVLRLAFSA
jgi:hypothetical protein